MPTRPASPWTPQRLRQHLAFEIRDWARLLGVTTRTVDRWEEGGTVPSGLAAEVFRGVAAAVEAGVLPATIHKSLSLGLAGFLRASLENGKHR